MPPLSTGQATQPRSTNRTPPVPWGRALAADAVLLAGTAILFLVIQSWGPREASPISPPETGLPDPAGSRHLLVHVLAALAAVVIVGRLLGRLLGRLGQPPVIGEVLGGILLGPSLLGRVWPQAAAFLMPPSVAPALGAVAQLGVVLYMFLVGLELNLGALRDRAAATLTIAHAGIAVPFVLGAALALYLYPRFSDTRVPFGSFALFVAVALSVTAFPVLARILTDRGMQRTSLGMTALGCAAVADVTAWCLLALVVGIAQARVGGAVLVLVLAAAFAALMLLVVRPLAIRFLAGVHEDRMTPAFIAVAFAALLLSALAAEWIGIHALFGAFLLGAIIPHDSPAARAFTRRTEDLVTVLLLPAFFAFTGMRTEIGLVWGAEEWLAAGLIILAATAGKVGGTVAAARLTGLGGRQSAALGVLMNTRGLMELIVLNVGLELKVISPALFAMMVLMALATTLATGPIVQWLMPKEPGTDSMASS